MIGFSQMRRIGKVKTKKGKDLIASASIALEKESGLSSEFKSSFQDLIEFTGDLLNHLGVSSSNSSLPPSQDPFRARNTNTSKAKGVKRKPGAQLGHTGSQLKQIENPAKIEKLFVDQDTLPKGKYTQSGFEKRQVFDVEISVVVTEYQAEILVDSNGNEFIAQFPAGVNQAAQYGASVKSLSVYMSQSQLIPLDRVRDFFETQCGLPLAKGSISNFNVLAYQKLESFEEWAKENLLKAPSINADETGININGAGHWLHCLSTPLITLLNPDEKRGTEAMVRMGVIPEYTGILTHDHWKPYFKFMNCTHSLCNAHHLRELERAFEQDGQKWAKQMQKLLIQMKTATEKAGGCLSEKEAIKFRKKYRKVLASANQECKKVENSRAQSKSRNLLERLMNFENETLLFMENIDVSFTNNAAENDQRMTKVQQKISGCFRSMDGAKIFCRIRAYLITCRKQGLSSSDALKLLFEGKQPTFMS